MFRQRVLTYLGVIIAVSGAVAGHLQTISPTAALWVILIGALATAAGGAVTKFLESNRAVTVTGVLVAVLGVLGQASNLIGNKWAQVAVIVGAAFTAIGKSLFGWTDDAPVIGSGVPTRSAFGLLLIFALGFSSVACNFKKVERPLTSAGYNFQITILAAARTTGAIRELKPGSIQDDKARTLFESLQKTSQIGQGFSQAIDKTVEVNPQSKVALLDEAERYLKQVDSTIALIDSSNTRLRNGLLVVREIAVAFKLSIAAIEITTPTQKVLADVTKAKGIAVTTSGTRDINDTVALVNALGVISADFAADVVAQKGLDVAALRSLRDAKYNAVQSYIAEQLAKIPAPSKL